MANPALFKRKLRREDRSSGAITYAKETPPPSVSLGLAYYPVNPIRTTVLFESRKSLIIRMLNLTHAGRVRPLKWHLLALAIIALLAGRTPAQVKINEVVYDDAGTDDSTWVEIWGPDGTPLSGYQLVGVSGYNGEEYTTIDLTGSIPSNGFFVVGQVAFPNVDQVSSLVNFQNSPDNILLMHNGDIVDALGYGDFTDPDTFFVGEGQPAPDQVAGTSLIRYPDGYDTNNNADDFSLTPYLTPGAANVPEGEALFYSLIELRTNPPAQGEIFWTTGIATVDAGLFNGPTSISAYMQDDLAGINIYGGQFAFAPGDCLWIKARLGEYNGLLHLYDPLELNVGINVGAPDSLEVTCAVANNQGESLESMLVWLRSVWITQESEAWPIEGQDANLNITDITSQDLVMRLDKDTDLDGWADHPDVEEHFDLIGILSQYNAYQVLPRSQADFLPPTAVLPEGNSGMPAGFWLARPHPNPFNPTTSVRFGLIRPGRIDLRVYSIDGSLIATLASGQYSQGAYTAVWDVQGLPSGVYVLRLRTAEGSQAVKALLLR